jgi:hypothetical protein
MRSLDTKTHNQAIDVSWIKISVKWDLCPLYLFGANNVSLLWHITHFSSNVLQKSKALWQNELEGWVGSIVSCSWIWEKTISKELFLKHSSTFPHLYNSEWPIMSYVACFPSLRLGLPSPWHEPLYSNPSSLSCQYKYATEIYLSTKWGYREHTVNQFPYNPTTYDYSYIWASDFVAKWFKQLVYTMVPLHFEKSCIGVLLTVSWHLIKKKKPKFTPSHFCLPHRFAIHGKKH